MKYSSRNRVIHYLIDIISEEIYTKNEVVALAKAYAKENWIDIKWSTLNTYLSDAKNPKYCPFPALIAEKNNGILYFMTRQASFEAAKTQTANIKAKMTNDAELLDIYNELDEKYFKSRLKDICKIRWGRRPSNRRRYSLKLGYYTRDIKRITISPILKGEKIPKHVLYNIVFHEMVHAYLDAEKIKEKRVHGRTFEAYMSLFPEYEKSEKWLKDNPNLLFNS